MHLERRILTGMLNKKRVIASPPASRQGGFLSEAEVSRRGNLPGTNAIMIVSTISNRLPRPNVFRNAALKIVFTPALKSACQPAGENCFSPTFFIRSAIPIAIRTDFTVIASHHASPIMRCLLKVKWQGLNVSIS